MSRVVGQIRSADVRAPLEELGGLLPGSSAADAARGCALASSRGLAGWCDHAQTHAANLIGSGAGYSDTEHGATNIFPLGEY